MEATGGIIRNTWVEVRPASFVDNVRFAYALNSDYSVCTGKPRVMVSSAEAASGTAVVVLEHGGAEVARAAQPIQLRAGANEAELAFEFKEPILWSPEFPNLYELTATIKTSAGEDSWSCKTGFRTFAPRGENFC